MMRIDALKMGIAAAVALAVIWVICSLLVWLVPVPMMTAGGHMIHTDLSDMAWRMSLGGVGFGLVAWSVVAGFTAWLVTTVYNKMV